MSDRLLNLCSTFLKLAQSLDGDVSQVEQELQSEFVEPARVDQEDFLILIKRALKGDLTTFVTSMLALDKLARNFKHESYTPEFYDFVSDEDVFEWVHSIADKSELTEFDKGYLSYIIRDLQAFQSGNIFK